MRTFILIHLVILPFLENAYLCIVTQHQHCFLQDIFSGSCKPHITFYSLNCFSSMCPGHFARHCPPPKPGLTLTHNLMPRFSRALLWQTNDQSCTVGMLLIVPVLLGDRKGTQRTTCDFILKMCVYELRDKITFITMTWRCYTTVQLSLVDF